MKRSTLILDGDFYKGNLHTHTTLSDGRKTPEEMVTIYKTNGYSFLSLTDHNVYGIHEEFNSEHFILLPGTEVDTKYGQKPPKNSVHHLLGIGQPGKNTYTHGHNFDYTKQVHMHPQDVIDELRENGNLVIYNHPYWSKVDFSDIQDLRDLNGMEIYNYNCDVESRCGAGDVFYDNFLLHQNIMWCYGTDDAHMEYPDTCGGYITVKAKELSHEAICEALISGSFYASAATFGKSAPEISNFYVEDGIAKIFCSPSSRIYFKAGKSFLPIQDLEGHNLTYAEYKLPAESTFVRAICVDQWGHASYTQPIVIPTNMVK